MTAEEAKHEHSERLEECRHEKAEFIGLLFANKATGYCTQGARCLNCGEIGQVPAMFEPEVIDTLRKHPEFTWVDT